MPFLWAAVVQTPLHLIYLHSGTAGKRTLFVLVVLGGVLRFGHGEFRLSVVRSGKGWVESCDFEQREIVGHGLFTR
jgi:hypothetical protein